MYNVMTKMKMINKILILALLVLLSTYKYASAQDTILTFMLNKSDIVAHVEILEIQGGKMEELGVEEWAALCKIIQPIKGLIKRDEKIRFRFSRFVFQGKEEPFVVEKGKEYVIFLKGSSGKVRFPSDKNIETAYDLLDHWVGVLSYHYHLVERLVNHIAEK
jgi:hypothetical protein